MILEGNQAIVCHLAAIYLELILWFPVISVRKRLWFSQLLSAQPASPSVPETLRGASATPVFSADPRQLHRSGLSSGRELPPDHLPC